MNFFRRITGYVTHSLTSHVFHWQAYRKFFDISLFRYLMPWFALVPLFIAFFNNVPETISIAIGTQIIELTPSLPFNWFVLWLASVFYVLAFILYMSFCPAFIREYPSYSAYSARGHSPRWLAWLILDTFGLDAEPKSNSALRDVLITKRRAVPAEDIWVEKLHDVKPIVDKSEHSTSLYFLHCGQPYVLPMTDVTDEGIVRDVFWDLFGLYAKSKLFFRWMIGILVSIVLILILFVLIQNISEVIYFLVRSV